MPRYAAIDIGTNSVKITVADVRGGTLAELVMEKTKVTRLGRGVDKTRRFEDASIEATLQAMREFADEARSLGVQKIVAGGTSAMRDATNGDEFRRRAAEITGGEIEVVTGAREAELTFLGAMSDPNVAGDGGGVLAFDVGGGSTELITGTGGPHPKIDQSQSLDIGAVRLTERNFGGETPTQDELAGAQAAVDHLLAGFQSPDDIQRIIGIGGTVVSVATMLQAENDPDAPPVTADAQGATVSAAALDKLIPQLAGMTLDERKAVAGLDPSRADVVVAGMLIIRRVLAHFKQDTLIVSTRGVRHGLLLELAR